MLMAEVRVFEERAALMQAAAEYLIGCSQAAIRLQGRFTIALSGGSTPKALYESLVQAQGLDWSRIHIFWGDERNVGPDDPESNCRMASQALLDHVPIPPEQIHRIEAERGPQAAADAYEATLRQVFGQAVRFDLILLGMGDDGHTASLFPNTAALDENERLVVANHVPQLNTWRITLTAPLINRAAHVAFLITGESKAEPLRAVLRGPHQPQTLPSQLIEPEKGELVYFVDQAAAALLS
jgi:6-phosphogluconolactonase